MGDKKAQYGGEYQAHLLEQYKLYVEMTDRISQRRMDTNKFFISIQTFVITVMSLFSQGNAAILAMMCLVGLLLCGAWYFLLKRYRQLNSGKFEVIHDMEARLPMKPYDLEWQKLGEGKDTKQYLPLSHVEVAMPLVFALMYVGFWWYIMYCVKNGMPISFGTALTIPAS